MIIRIQHLTKHQYDRPVSFGEHSLFLRPLDSHRRRVDKFTVETIPQSRQRWVRDVYGNLVMICNFGLRESPELEFKVEIEVEIAEDNPFDFILDENAASYPLRYEEKDETALLPFFKGQSNPSGKVNDWFRSVVQTPDSHDNTVQYLSDLNAAIRREIAYQRRDEEGIQSPEVTLQLGKGSCRDMAVLFIEIARQRGFAARFASGYLYDPPTGEGSEYTFNRAVGSMHAWAEIYLPGAGWKGFDPTNGILANSHFIPSGVSHEPKFVDPIQGAFYSKSPAQSTIEVDLQMEELTHG